ncbi:DUF2914 domain-containing protein [Nannocystaceae bacterium ST9]
MANRDDDETGSSKPLFVPPTLPVVKPSGGSSLFAPPSLSGKPLAAPTIVPSKAPPVVASPVVAPVFAEWPDEVTPAPTPSSEPPAPAEQDTNVVEVVEAVEAVEAPASVSGLRAPVHARKTSTQAHSVVGEFGVPSPTDSKPSTAIVDHEDQDDDQDEDDADFHPNQPESRVRAADPSTSDDQDLDDPERTDEEPHPIAVARSTPSEPKRGSAPLLIGLGLAATLVVALVVGMQDRGKNDPDVDPAKPNRSESVERGEPSKTGTQPRPPETSRTKLGDPPGETGAALATETETDTGEPGTGTETDTGTSTGSSTGSSTGDDVDPRDPSVIPPGTPEDNVKAFLKIPVSVHDGRPLGGIGRTGIHIDAITTGREYKSGQCNDEVREFSIATDKEVSVCFRVVHDREEESVRILWDKDGVTTRRGGVRIRDLHAYKTRAYLDLRPEYVGEWRVRVVSEDDVELAAFEFEIGP